MGKEEATEREERCQTVGSERGRARGGKGLL
jgi:hypothetical protein